MSGFKGPGPWARLRERPDYLKDVTPLWEMRISRAAWEMMCCFGLERQAEKAYERQFYESCTNPTTHPFRWVDDTTEELVVSWYARESLHG